MYSSGACVTNVKNSLSGDIFGGYPSGFTMAEVISVKVKQHESPVVSWSPIALVGRVAWRITAGSGYSTILTLKRVKRVDEEVTLASLEAGDGDATASTGRSSKKTETMQWHLYPQSVDNAIAQQARNAINAFLVQDRRLVRISTSSETFPRLVALLLLLASIIVYFPAGAKRWMERATELASDLYHSRGCHSEYSSADKQQLVRKRFKWTPERDGTLLESMDLTPKGESGRWEAIAHAVGCSDKEAERRAKELKASNAKRAIKEDKEDQLPVLGAAERKKAEALARRVEESQAEREAAEACFHALRKEEKEKQAKQKQRDAEAKRNAEIRIDELKKAEKATEAKAKERKEAKRVAEAKRLRAEADEQRRIGQEEWNKAQEARRQVEEQNRIAAECRKHQEEKQQQKEAAALEQSRNEEALRAVPPPAAAEPAPFSSASEVKGEWTTEEQKALERGLKEFPSTDPERWDRIAIGVGSRTKKECKARFKAIAEALRAKKAE